MILEPFTKQQQVSFRPLTHARFAGLALLTIALVKVRRTHKTQLGTSPEHQPIEDEITVRSKPNEPKRRLALSKLPL